MAENPIPENLKSNHLFLLVGTNPLPNWVSTRLLLREGGQVYLVHSEQVIEIARRLARVLLRQGCRQPEYVPIDDSSDASAVYRVVARRVKAIKSGQIGFNYTGGTKVMAVHGHRAMMGNLPRGTSEPVFSYLDARTLKMRFDSQNIEPITVGLEVQLSINEMLELHDTYQLNEPNREPVAWPVIEELVKLHSKPQGYQIWGRHVRELIKNPLKRNLTWVEELRPIAEVLAEGRPLEITFDELCRERVWPFGRASQLLDWLKGDWLEHYVLGLLKKHQTQWGLHDYGQDITPQRSSPIKYQIDAAAIRGYQFHIFSCYSGRDKERGKLKLFEAFIRARQIGGDEAGAALVCMSNDPLMIENDIAQTVHARNRVKVFGYSELKNLDKHLKKWFQK